MTKIVIDLEWNRPLAGRRCSDGLPGEIIQIGAAKIDDNCNVTDTFDQIIKPFYYKRINKDVEKLTLITDDDLEKGLPFLEVIESFKNWCGDDFTLLSWGPDDIIMLERNCDKFGFDRSWLPKSYDVQLMFDDMEMQEDRTWPLNYALYHFQEKPDGAHNALADVLSTVLIMKHFDINAGIQDDYFRTDSIEDDAPSDVTES